MRIDFKVFDPIDAHKMLRHQVQREKLNYSKKVIRYVNTILTSQESSAVVDACFNLVEHGVFKHTSDFLNSAYVRYVSLEDANGALDIESKGSEFGHVESNLIQLSAKRNNLSMGIYLRGMRELLSRGAVRDSIQAMLSKIHNDFTIPNWGDKLHAHNSNEYFLVRLERSLEGFKLAGQKYSIPSESMEVFLKDRESSQNLNNSSATWDKILSAIVTFRNAKAHDASAGTGSTHGDKSSPWWHADERFIKLVRSYLEPAVLQLIVHPKVKDFLCAERIRLLDRRGETFRLERLSAHNDLCDPNATVQRRPELTHEMTTGVEAWAKANSPHHDKLNYLFPIQAFPSPGRDDTLFNNVMECLITLFYINDGIIKADERYILETLADKRGISDLYKRLNDLIITLDHVITKSSSIDELKIAFIQNLSWISECFEEVKDECRRLCDLIINEQFGEKEQKEDTISLTAVHDRVTKLKKQVVTDLCQEAILTPEHQYKVIRERLQDSYILSLNELSDQLGLPEVIVQRRLDEITNSERIVQFNKETSASDSNMIDFQVVRYNSTNNSVRYRLKDVDRINSFNEILSEVQSDLNKTTKSAPPQYLERLLSLCALYIRNEDDAEVWVERVDELLSEVKGNVGKPELCIKWGKGEESKVIDVNVEKLLDATLNMVGIKLDTLNPGQYFRFRSDRYLLTIADDKTRRLRAPIRAADLAHLIGTIGTGEHTWKLPKLLYARRKVTNIVIKTPKEDGEKPVESKIDVVSPNLISIKQTFSPNMKTYRGGKSKLHFKLSFEHNGKQFFTDIRVDSLPALYAQVLYSLNITRWHFTEKHHGTIVDQRQWYDEYGEPLLLNESIWSEREEKLYKSWPILIGRVRYLFNISPYHSNNRPFDLPVRLLLGERFDLDGELIEPPISYYFEVQGSTDEKIDQLSGLCHTLGVTMSRLEYYPTIHFTKRDMTPVEIELNPHEEFLDLISHLLRHGYRPADKSAYTDQKSSSNSANSSDEVSTVEGSTLGWLYPGHERKHKHRKYLIASMPLHPNGQTFDDYELLESAYYIDRIALKDEFSFELIEYTLEIIFNLTQGPDADFMLVYRTYEEMLREHSKREALIAEVEITEESDSI